MNLLANKTVAIIGGGPGGLTLARLLQQQGVQVNVYERDIDRIARVQGATLDLHHHAGLKAITAAGLLDAFKANYRPGHDCYRIVDKNGTIHYDEMTKTTTADFGDETFRPEIDRGPLRDILLDSLHPGTVIWNSHITSLEKGNDTWKIIFKNGQEVIADIVIGADGANSKIRPYVTSITPAYSGLTYIVGNIPNSEKNTPTIWKMIKDGMISAMDESKCLSLSTRGDGSLDFYIGWKTESEELNFTDIHQLREWFNIAFDGWAPIWLELFSTDETDVAVRPLTGMPADLYWPTQSNITLIGDAAHVLPPNGDGVNFAMLDALILSENLTSRQFETISAAIADYEEKMIKRFAIERVDTFAMLEDFYAPDARQKMIDMIS